MYALVPQTKLREERIKQGYSQRQFSEKIHTCQSLVSSVEVGNRLPWPSFVKKCCNLLKKGKEDLFIFTEEE